MLLEQQGGYTKFPCFLCMCYSLNIDLYWIRKDQPFRIKILKPVSRKYMEINLVDPEKVLLPPLDIKMGHMK